MTTARADRLRNDDRILRAAARVLGRDRDAGVSAVAEAAGVGRLTVYRRYPDRDALVTALREAVDGELEEALTGLPGWDDGPAALRALVTALSRVVARYPVALLRHAPVPGARPAADAAVTALLRQGQRAGYLREDLAAETLNRALFGVLSTLTHGDPGLDEDLTPDPGATASTVLSLLQPGLTRSPGPPRSTPPPPRRKVDDDQHRGTHQPCQSQRSPGPDEDFLLHLRDVVGAEHVLTGDALADHADPYSFLEEEDVPRPLAAVRPASVEEVQAVVALAVATGHPLWTVSRGRNYAYGGAAARLPGATILDLGRMDRVLAVDEELGYVVVEPGVSFLDLHAHLRARGSALLMSVPDIGWGSVLANALERGIGYAQHGDHSAHLCGLEVVMADGTLVRTGMGALPGSTAGPLYRGGYGPSLDGLFQQSNLGIVTKVAVWMAPRPQTVAVCSVRASSDDALATLVDLLRPLQLDATIQTPVTVGSAGILAVALSERSRWRTQAGPMDDADVQRVVDELHVGHWNAGFALYGPTALVQARLDVVRAALEGSQLQLVSRSYPGDVPPEEVFGPHLSQLGVPTLGMARMAQWRGGTPAHTDLSLVCPTRGEDVLRQRDLLRDAVRSHGFDYAGGFTMYGRHTIALALVAFDRASTSDRAAVRALVPDVVEQAAALGYAPYRAHTAFMDVVADRYCDQDSALRRTVEKIKDALDPRGVLSPGKQGIWPGGSRVVPALPLPASPH